MVAVGFTAYGWDSLPTNNAPTRAGEIPALFTARHAASYPSVTVSSSTPATAFSTTPSPACT